MSIALIGQYPVLLLYLINTNISLSTDEWGQLTFIKLGLILIKLKQTSIMQFSIAP